MGPSQSAGEGLKPLDLLRNLQGVGRRRLERNDVSVSVTGQLDNSLFFSLARCGKYGQKDIYVKSKQEVCFLVVLVVHFHNLMCLGFL